MFATLLLTALFGALFTAFRPRYGARFISAMFGGLFLGLIGSTAATLSPVEARASISRLTMNVVTIYCGAAVLIMMTELWTQAWRARHPETPEDQEFEPDHYPVTALASGKQAYVAVVDDGYRLIDPDAVTITVRPINCDTLLDFRKDCERAVTYGHTKVCIELNTGGGFAVEAYAMVDIICELRQTADVYVRVLGDCMSAGNIILMSVPREKRIAGRNSRFMLHTASGTDKQSVMETNAKMAKLLADGTFLDETSLIQLFDSKQDCYLTADEALARGLVGAVR
jgi:hypothetical protein